MPTGSARKNPTYLLQLLNNLHRVIVGSHMHYRPESIRKCSCAVQTPKLLANYTRRSCRASQLLPDAWNLFETRYKQHEVLKHSSLLSRMQTRPR
eukprot:1084269-Amphidinium_carterae.1